MQVSDYHKNLASGHLWGDKREVIWRRTEVASGTLFHFYLGDGFVDFCFVIIKLYIFVLSHFLCVCYIQQYLERKEKRDGIGDTDPRDPREIAFWVDDNPFVFAV